MSTSKKNQKTPLNKKIPNTTSTEDPLLNKIRAKLNQKNIPLPRDESIKLLLQNEEIKKLISFLLEKHSERKTEIDIRKKILFYYVNNQKIDNYIKLRNAQKEKKKQIETLKKKLKSIKDAKKNYQIKNSEILASIKSEKKEDKLSRIKLSIINSPTNTNVLNMLNDINKYSYLNGYRYTHLFPKNTIGNIIEEEDEEENKINSNKQETNKNNNYKSFISMTDNNFVNNNNMNNNVSNSSSSSNAQLVNLPKLSDEDIINYTSKINQKNFFENSIKELKNIKNILTGNQNNSSDKSLLISDISISNNNINNEEKFEKLQDVTAIENKTKQKLMNEEDEKQCKEFFNQINNDYKNDIQNEEQKISNLYLNKMHEENLDNKFNDLQEEINSLRKKNKISDEIWEKISNISKIKLIKDLNDQYLKSNDNKKIIEKIIPKCVIEKNTQNVLNFYRNVISTYKKYKTRTDNFLNKRVFQALLNLEERHTDFMTTVINEYDYFAKLSINELKYDGVNGYSIKNFRYNMSILKNKGVNNKYDIFGFYLSDIYMKKIMYENQKLNEEFNNSEALKNFFNFMKDNEIFRKNIMKYFNSTIFGADLNFYYDKDEIELTQNYLNEYINVEYLKYLKPY